MNYLKLLWVLNYDPDGYPHGKFSAFLQKLTRERFEFEYYVRQFFESDSCRNVDFQRVLKTNDRLFDRVDALEQLADGEVIFFEVKSLTNEKTGAAHNHIKDACFQKI